MSTQEGQAALVAFLRKVGQPVTLRINVYFGTPKMTLTGYKKPEQPWQWLEYDQDMADFAGVDTVIHFTTFQFDQALRTTGLNLEGRPIKQGMAYDYKIVAIEAPPEGAGPSPFKATSLSPEEMDRRQQMRYDNWRNDQIWPS